jgi:hypothetical protein
MIWDHVTNKTLVRIGGMMLYILLAPLAILAAFLLPLMILASPLRSKQAIRTLDELVNTFWFNGSAYESLSSHAWTRRETWWGKLCIGITDLMEKDHCKTSNEYEQQIVKFVEGVK